MKNKIIKVITITLIFVIMLVAPMFAYISVNNPLYAKTISEDITEEMLKQMIIPSLIFTGLVVNNQDYINKTYNYFHQ